MAGGRGCMIGATSRPDKWSRLDQAPNRSAPRASRSRPAGERLKTGVGEVAKYGPPAPQVPQHVDPRLRKKILKRPNEIWDEAAGAWTGDHDLHCDYETEGSPRCPAAATPVHGPDFRAGRGGGSAALPGR